MLETASPNDESTFSTPDEKITLPSRTCDETLPEERRNDCGMEMLGGYRNLRSATETKTRAKANANSSVKGSPPINGHTRTGRNGDSVTNTNNDDDGPPQKRRRTRDCTPSPAGVRKCKPESPPWRKVQADGPTSYTVNGRRKSGRINNVPSARRSAGDKRMTRTSPSKTLMSSQSKQETTANGKFMSRVNSSRKQKQDLAHEATPRLLSSTTPRSAAKKRDVAERSSLRSSRRRTPSPPARPKRHSSRARPASRLSQSTAGRQQTIPRLSKRHQPEAVRSPQIKLRVGRSGTIPLVHAEQARKHAKIGTSFEDFWQRAGDIPAEEGGLLVAEDGPIYTMETARRDAQQILRIEKETKPGGMLSRDRCSLFAPEPAEEPPRQWARQDHMTKAMANFRKLMLAEQQRHKATAKRIADACRESWLRRQPKSAEQIETEEREMWLQRYRSVVKTLSGTWENVRVQVNQRRLEEWEAEEQRRVKAALNEAVSLSEQKLQARRFGLDSEFVSDENGSDNSNNHASFASDVEADSELASDESIDQDMSDKSSDMSSSDEEEADDEAKDGGDEGLTQEQLKEKYAHLPGVDPSMEMDLSINGEHMSDDCIELATGEDDTTDESVDMADDMGSTEDDDSDEQSGQESSEDDRSGLLGLLFNKAELRQIEQEENEESQQPLEEHIQPMREDDLGGSMAKTQNDAHAEKCDVDEVSLVQHTGLDQVKIFGQEQDRTGPVCDSSSTADVPISHYSAADGQPNGALRDQEHSGRPWTRDIDVPIFKGRSEHLKAEAVEANPADSDTLRNAGSPETDYITNTTGQNHSLSPPTSETKQSDVETNYVGETALDKSVVHGEPTDQLKKAHEVNIPFLLRGTLREYQHDGLDWLAGLYANNTNGILADEMGLGKTIQTIALLAHLACFHEVWGPHLVIVPTSVMLNWEMEFKKWCPGFKILAYYGSQEERKRKRQGWNSDDVWNVCITSYQLVLQDQQVFKRRRWHYMILDEAHNIKNFKSQRWQTLLGFNTQARLLLTGTPLQNNLTELWSLLFFLMPSENGVGGFADLQEFHDWFHKPESQILESGREHMDEEAKAIISKLHKVLRPYLLRRLKADVEKQMPAKYEHVEFCRLSKRQRELYDGFLSRADTRETLASGNYMSIINCLMQLRKVCNHPDLFVDRPIMTSFCMSKSVASEYEGTEQAFRRSLLAEKPMSVVNLGFLNLIPTQHEHLSSVNTDSIAQLSSHRALMDLREAQKLRAQLAYTTLDPSTVSSNIDYLESAARWGRFEELQHCVYLNALRRQQRPIYGKNVVSLVTVGADRRPRKLRPRLPQRVMSWFEEESNIIGSLTPCLAERADSLKTIIEKFSCVTPAVAVRDLEKYILGRAGIEAFSDEDLRLSQPVRWAPFLPKEPPPDPWHESRMRHTIQFPDKRLLQYDCGKLQVLDKLLRRLQAGGHRALIFTQMTKVLDILEQFLNIHGHKYLRLDGATKVEQRQILTDRFNHDNRILCFILSTRSGGLGINLTGADTVIFYDQDWNPAMDKQCQDRCHRIGQTRDVHIYRLVSEHTIEANILRKASQKQMLDDVVIQEGEFTTNHFNKVSVRDVLGEKVDFTSEGVAAADAALDRVLGGPDVVNDQRRVGRVLEQAEDKEDVTAARAAEKEIQADDADFTEKPSQAASQASSTRQGTPAGRFLLEGDTLGVTNVQIDQDEESNAWGEKLRTIDDFMLSYMAEQLRHTKLELPKIKSKNKKKGKGTRKR